MKSIPDEIKLMKQIAEHLKIWFQDAPGDEHYPSGTVPLKIRNNISLNVELASLEKVTTWLRVNDHKDIARSLEQKQDSFLSDLREVEQAIDHGDNPPLELIQLRSKITGLIGMLEYTAKVFTDNLADGKPEGAGQESKSTLISEGKNATKSNVSGMPWQKARKKAEALVDEKGYLGFQKLTKAVGCSEGTLRKIIKEKSSKLRQAKKQYESTSKTLKAVGFTAKVIATYEDSSGSQLSDTETHGILTEMLDHIKRERPEMFEQTKKQLDEMNPDGKRKFAAIYQRDYQNKDKSLSKDGPKTLRQYKQV
jgi:hypothetical protein